MSGLVPVGAGLPRQHKRALRAVAELRDVPMAEIVREALATYLGLGELPPDVRTWRERQRVLARRVAAEPPPADTTCVVEALRSGCADDLVSMVRAAARPDDSWRLAS